MIIKIQEFSLNQKENFVALPRDSKVLGVTERYGSIILLVEVPVDFTERLSRKFIVQSHNSSFSSRDLKYIGSVVTTRYSHICAIYEDYSNEDY